jgi:hypothetical protein
MFSLPSPDEEAPPDPSPSDPPSSGGPSERLVRGVQGGALGTLVMTVFRLPVTRSLPPSADFWAQFVGGGRASDHRVAGLLLHLVYGAAAGTVFAAALPSRESVETSGGRRGPPTPVEHSATGPLAVGYAVLLAVFGERVLLAGLLDIAPDDRYAFHAAHLVYGLTLGAWLATRTDDG